MLAQMPEPLHRHEPGGGQAVAAGHEGAQPVHGGEVHPPGVVPHGGSVPQGGLHRQHAAGGTGQHIDPPVAAELNHDVGGEDDGVPGIRELMPIPI